MDSKLLEDVIALIENNSFSRAAEQRNLSQSAFSRRIQAFEQWCGFEIVDRTTLPISINTIIKSHLIDIKKIILKNEELKHSIRGQYQKKIRQVIATQHTLALSHLPDLLNRKVKNDSRKNINEQLINKFRVRTYNRQQAITEFLLGQAEILLIFALPKESLEMLEKFPSKIIDSDTLIPVKSPSLTNDSKSLSVLGYPEESYFYQVLQQNISQNIFVDIQNRVIYESAIAENLRHMCKNANGIAFLPKKLIKEDIDNLKLSAIDEDIGHVDLNIIIFAKTPALLDGFTAD